MEMQLRSLHGSDGHSIPTTPTTSRNIRPKTTRHRSPQRRSKEDEADRWVQLAVNLKYILINTPAGAAATTCRQHQSEMGLEVYRQPCHRFSIPLGTRSIGYLTRLLKPIFDNSDFEESFSNWEFELSRYERGNNAHLPDAVKIAISMNETTGALHQNLQLNAGTPPFRGSEQSYWNIVGQQQHSQGCRPSPQV